MSQFFQSTPSARALTSLEMENTVLSVPSVETSASKRHLEHTPDPKRLRLNTPDASIHNLSPGATDRPQMSPLLAEISGLNGGNLGLFGMFNNPIIIGSPSKPGSAPSSETGGAANASSFQNASVSVNLTILPQNGSFHSPMAAIHGPLSSTQAPQATAQAPQATAQALQATVQPSKATIQSSAHTSVHVTDLATGQVPCQTSQTPIQSVPQATIAIPANHNRVPNNHGTNIQISKEIGEINPDLPPQANTTSGATKKQIERMEKQKQRELERLEREAAKEVERQLKKEERERKDRERQLKREQIEKEKERKREEERAKREEKRKKVEEERKRKEEERKQKEEEKKQKEEDRKRKEEQKDRNQMKISSFFAVKPIKPVSRPVTPKETTVEIENTEKPLMLYSRQFLPFFIKLNVVMAADGVLLAEELSKNISAFDSEMKQTFQRAELSAMFPKARIPTPHSYTSAEILLEALNSASTTEKQLHLLVDNLPPIKYLQFYENSKPPYVGTWCSEKHLRTKITQSNPLDTSLTGYDYNYDSDLDWQDGDDDEGEDIDDLEDGDDDDDEANEDDDMEDFVDDNNEVSKRRIPVGTLKSVNKWNYNTEEDNAHFDDIKYERLDYDIQFPIDPYCNYWSTAKVSVSVRSTKDKAAEAATPVKTTNGTSSPNILTPQKPAIKDAKVVAELIKFVEKNSDFTIGTLSELAKKEFKSYTKSMLKHTIQEVASYNKKKSMWEIKQTI
ncbi:CIC11C00000001037 [Sungouiella intermedia]|uniref:CIC11C00000001037 n=1 Tax=Sungouiella intermedia TaxID=45354 RepID=A0A1L0BF85_9ASCO|nr:CIC11C00000001037 [[Candida] intermedia]